VGNGSKHLKLNLSSGDNSPKIFDAIGFGLGDKFPNLKNGDSVDIVFNLQEDEWNGNKKIQLKLIDLEIN
jgi:single-stranded-DNA-specific exonuclease